MSRAPPEGFVERPHPVVHRQAFPPQQVRRRKDHVLLQRPIARGGGLGDTLNADLVGVAGAAMEPEHVSLWLRPDTQSKDEQQA